MPFTALDLALRMTVSDEHVNIIYTNDAYRDLVPGACDDINSEPWWEMIPDEQIPMAKEFHRQLTQDHVKATFELASRRFAKNSNAPTDEYRWVLVSAYPELHEDSRLKYLTGCMADINDLKLPEQAQAARIADALESTQKLEWFIDMPSHEMRNPLSTIAHSAKEIPSTLRADNPQELAKATLAEAIEAAGIIFCCADHPTRIVDDILLVFKLESGLLTISPTVVQPVGAVRRALKTFEGEMRAADISHAFILDDSFDFPHIDGVKLDMSRVLQIFVNLITNAIKFTQPESLRHITVYMSASLRRPNEAVVDNRVHYLESQTAPAITNIDGKIVYVNITVDNTGCGMTEAEQKNLFLRFSGRQTNVCQL